MPPFGKNHQYLQKLHKTQNPAESHSVIDENAIPESLTYGAEMLGILLRRFLFFVLSFCITSRLSYPNGLDFHQRSRKYQKLTNRDRSECSKRHWLKQKTDQSDEGYGTHKYRYSTREVTFTCSKIHIKIIILFIL